MNSHSLKENDVNSGYGLSDTAIMISGSEASDEEEFKDVEKYAQSGVSGILNSPLQNYKRLIPSKINQSKSNGEVPTSTITSGALQYQTKESQKREFNEPILDNRQKRFKNTNFEFPSKLTYDISTQVDVQLTDSSTQTNIHLEGKTQFFNSKNLNNTFL